MDHQTVVAENRAALQATIEFGTRKLGSAKWEPAAGSEGAAELVTGQTKADGTPWDEDQPRTAYAAANLMMHGVLDNLAALYQLLDDRMSVIGPTVVARSAIEIASGVWWLMEPGIGVRNRVCRELVLSLTSAQRAGQLAGEFQATGIEVSEAIAEAAEEEDRVLQRIADLGIGSPSGARYFPKIENQKAPDATHGIATMLKTVMPAGSPGTEVYRTYSAVTHGEIYGLMSFMSPGASSDGMNLLHWHLPPDVLDSTIQLAIGAFREAWRRVNEVMDGGKLEADLWEIKLSKIYAGTTGPATLSRAGAPPAVSG